MAKKEGCVEPAGGPIVQEGDLEKGQTMEAGGRETAMVRAQVGYEAPDFEANALVGDGFETVKLSDYRGKWVVLCFYPGDFTFV